VPPNCRRVSRYINLFTEYRFPCNIITWTYRWPSDCFGTVCCPPKAVAPVWVDGVGCLSGRLLPAVAVRVVCVRFPGSWPRSNSCWWPSTAPESEGPIVTNPVGRETNSYYYCYSIVIIIITQHKTKNIAWQFNRLILIHIVYIDKIVRIQLMLRNPSRVLGRGLV